MMAAPIEIIRKTVFSLNDYLQVGIEVYLGSKTWGGGRKSFMKESIYETTKYGANTHLSAINIDSKDFLILKSTIPYAKRQERPDFKDHTLAFSYASLYQLEMAISTCLGMVTDQSNTIFTHNRQGVVETITKQGAQTQIRCPTHYSKFDGEELLLLYPTIRVLRDDTREKAIIVAFYYNDTVSEITSLSYHELSSLLYFLTHFDLSVTCTTLVNQALINLPWLRENKK